MFTYKSVRTCSRTFCLIIFQYMFQLRINRKTIQKTLFKTWLKTALGLRFNQNMLLNVQISFYMQAACVHAQHSSLCIHVCQGGSLAPPTALKDRSLECVLCAHSHFFWTVWNRRATLSLKSHLLRSMRLLQYEGICECLCNDIFTLRVTEHLILVSSSATASATQDINDCNLSARDLQRCTPPWLQESSVLLPYSTVQWATF